MSGAEVLTPEEISTLLDGERGAEGPRADSSEPVPLDLFKKRSGAALGVPNLDPLPEKLSRALSQLLALSMNGASAEIEADPSLVEFDEFVRGLSQPGGFMMTGAAPLADQVILAVDAAAAGAAVSLLFGGGGDAARPPGRDFSMTELRIATRLLEAARAALLSCLGVNPGTLSETDRLETEPSSLDLVQPHELVAVLTFVLRLGDGTGRLTLALPAGAVGALDQDEPEAADPWRARLVEATSHARIGLRVRIAQFDMCISDLMALKAGDFIPVELTREVTVLADGQALFDGELGVSGSHKAVHIQAVSEAASLSQESF